MNCIQTAIGYNKICRYLNEKKVPTPSKHKTLQGSKFVCPSAPDGSENWSIGTVAKILKNETYDGILVQNKTETISHNIKKKRKVPKSEQTIVACCHERIIDPKISRIVRDKFSVEANNKNMEGIQTRAKPTKKRKSTYF